MRKSTMTDKDAKDAPKGDAMHSNVFDFGFRRIFALAASASVQLALALHMLASIPKDKLHLHNDEEAIYG